MALNARSKRRSAFDKNHQAKMTAEEYHELIGRHKHIEHKALRQEVTKEFEQISQNRKLSNRIIESGQSILNPPQPPILPMEENEAKNQKFVKSQTWPKLSIIQRCAQMLYYTLDPKSAHKFLEKKMNIPPEKLKIADQVYKLMIQSTNYWRKLNHIESNGKYSARYNSVTRKYALQKAPWTLQIAMTLIDFHLDHIVDIVYLKPLWSLDWDQECQRKQKQYQMSQQWNNNNNNDDEENESEQDSEEVPIAELIRDQQIKENEDYVNKVADHMTVEQIEDIKQKVQQQLGTSLEDLFGGMFNDMPNVAFASNFEVDLDDDNGSATVTEEIASDTDEYEEEEVASDEILIEQTLKLLYDKYPDLDRNLIRQAFIQENESYDATVFQLDNLNDSITNQFIDK